MHSASILPLRFSLREMTFFIYFIDYILVISSGRKCVTLHVSCHITKYFFFFLWQWQEVILNVDPLKSSDTILLALGDVH